ncbi:MAG TPA: lysine--tRNA ligase [Burkholderiales bacterium]|nr:lysine--tRNA ligase [Burkholderiales bacterium]
MTNLPINEENHIIQERRQKLNKIRNKTVAYPNNFSPTITAEKTHETYGNLDSEQLSNEKIPVKIAGRMMLKRIMGKASFATLLDGIAKIQIYISKVHVGEEKYEDFKHWDIGDILGVCGYLFKTKTGELTVEVEQIELLSKNLRPLPEKFHGLTDQEICYRQRYVDLIMNIDTKNIFIKRSKIIQSIRESMVSANYLEVETPMMHPIPGGATAQPFITHHNSLDMPLYLRVAPELYLKRLIVGGINRVFEINRNFRNEGLSTRHNPEFTMLEFYESYADYKKMMQLTEQIIRKAALDSIGTLQCEYQGKIVNLENDFDKLTIINAIIKYNPQYTFDNLNNIDFLKEEIYKLTKEKPSTNSLGVLQLLLFEETTEAKLWQPTFILDYPIDASPLARQSDTNPEITERFELFVVGRELANGYSELNDPEEQAERFKKQVAEKNAGNKEAMHYDADYIRALEYGMPPTGGCGIGIDRLTMLFTNAASIRDVIFFPHMRPE